jgi:hypothetical protein
MTSSDLPSARLLAAFAIDSRAGEPSDDRRFLHRWRLEPSCVQPGVDAWRSCGQGVASFTHSPFAFIDRLPIAKRAELRVAHVLTPDIDHDGTEFDLGL